LKLTNLVLKKPDPKTSREGMVASRWMEKVENKQSEVENKPTVLLEIVSNETGRTSKEVNLALEEAEEENESRGEGGEFT
jgi:predicted nucleic acid-binding protein